VLNAIDSDLFKLHSILIQPAI